MTRNSAPASIQVRRGRWSFLDGALTAGGITAAQAEPGGGDLVEDLGVAVPVAPGGRARVLQAVLEHGVVLDAPCVMDGDEVAQPVKTHGVQRAAVTDSGEVRVRAGLHLFPYRLQGTGLELDEVLDRCAPACIQPAPPGPGVRVLKVECADLQRAAGRSGGELLEQNPRDQVLRVHGHSGLCCQPLQPPLDHPWSGHRRLRSPEHRPILSHRPGAHGRSIPDQETTAG
jgi:hypothetical protein